MWFGWELESGFAGLDACGSLELCLLVVAVGAEGFEVVEVVLSAGCPVVFVVGVECAVPFVALVSAANALVVVASEAGLLEFGGNGSVVAVG